MYLTYDEYKKFGGTLEESTFTDFEIRAEMKVNYYTFNRLINDTKIPSNVKRLMYILIDLLQKQDEALSLGQNVGSSSDTSALYIKSQSNDGVSTTYNSMDSNNVFAMCDQKIKSNIETYLQGVMNEAGRKLLYRGLYPGE
nr:MAG TPA: Head Tail Connector Protein [Caudoviricetes sp.]